MVRRGASRWDASPALPERRESGGTSAEELARLRAENARLPKAEKQWRLERETPRRAAASFAREVK
jgi:transposase